MAKLFSAPRTLLAAVLTIAIAPGAFAQSEEAEAFPYGPPPEEGAPIPQHVEAAAVPDVGGHYCFTGPHPVDTRADPGAPWHEETGRHHHHYAPFDLRLFAYSQGCYQFVGDPRDFGYQGEAYSYYGAHPLHQDHGGGWCFMIGGHHHPWLPWSHHFVVVGPWYYWHGAYDAFFWSYWPYYSFYYRVHYPRHYGGGRFHREREVTVAPPIKRVPRSSAVAMPGWRGVPPSGGAAMQGAPTATPGLQGAPPAGARTGAITHPQKLGGEQRWRAAPSYSAEGYRGTVAPSAPAVPIPSTPPTRQSYGARGSESWNGPGSWGGGFSGSVPSARPGPTAPAPPSSRPAAPPRSGGRTGGVFVPRTGGGWRR